MSSRDRREFLKLCLAAPALVLADRAGISQESGISTPRQSGRTPASIDPYIDPLPLLKQIEPHEIRGTTDRYHIRMVEFEKQLHSQLPPTKLWGYEGQ